MEDIHSTAGDRPGSKALSVSVAGRYMAIDKACVSGEHTSIVE